MTRPLRFTDAPLTVVIDALERRVAVQRPGGRITCLAPDPDLGRGLYDGELIPPERALRHRSVAGWVAVAQALGCALRTPRPCADDPQLVWLTFERLPASDWHAEAPSGDPEKYGVGSAFARLDKFEVADHVVSFRRAIDFVGVPAGARVLAVGCNRGDELGQLASSGVTMRELVGVDHSPSAIARARERFADPHFRFLQGDLSAPETYAGLSRFDLVIAINVLHGGALDGQAVFRRLLADHLTPRGGLIIGLPNCRYVGGALRPGGAVKGRPHPSLAPVIKAAGYFKRALHRHRFDVEVLGQHTVLLAARPLGQRPRTG